MMSERKFWPRWKAFFYESKDGNACVQNLITKRSKLGMVVMVCVQQLLTNLEYFFNQFPVLFRL